MILILFFIYLIPDEPKLNSGTWDDPLPTLAASSPPKTDSLNTVTSSRRIETTNSTTRHNNSKPNSINNTQSHNNNHHAKATNNSTSQPNNTRRRLEHTPSARTISSEDSWCSEGPNSEHEISTDDEEDSDRSITSTTARNSQLRSTLNKAKHHLSFDKWRNGNNRNSTGEGNGTMPSQHSQETITTPGESPGGRLSRWFSIRRGSTHQYEVGGNRNSIDNDDPPPTPTSLHQQPAFTSPSSNKQQQNQQQHGQNVVDGRVPQGSQKKMPQLLEVSFIILFEYM